MKSNPLENFTPLSKEKLNEKKMVALNAVTFSNKGQKMKKQYYIDFEEFRLKRFKRSLQRRNMIPSRIILKQDIEERFKIFDSNGIETLKALIDALKSKEKIEDFSKKTGLSIEYLTVLKREINSYHPNPISLNKFSGVATKTIESLEKVGIRNTRQYFDKIICGIGTGQLAKETGISKDKLDELASLSDLARLYGVGPVFARIIYDVGVDSVESFVKYSAEEFIKIYENKTKKKADFGQSDIDFCMEIAKELLSNVKT